jgi:hypothetical protein
MGSAIGDPPVMPDAKAGAFATVRELTRMSNQAVIDYRTGR